MGITYSDRYLLGSFFKENNTAVFFTFPDPETNATEATIIEDVTTFEILTNPNACTTAWATDTQFYQLHGVRVNGTASPLIGRAPATEEFWLPGPIDENLEVVFIVVAGNLTEFSYYQVLSSTSKGKYT